MTYSKSIPIRPSTAIAALGAAILIAGCGSSGSSSTIGVGNENKSDEALAKATSSTPETPTTPPAATAKTPATGPLSKEPSVKPPSGAAPSKLVIKDLIKGTGKEAKAGGTVTVNDVGVVYKTGKQFENTFTRKEPSTFALSGLIPGWTKGIPGMRVGGRRELIIPPALAYGKAGRPPSIPPNAPLVFVIDLLAA
ncbi:MAG TPA: FKBP-type peptidyl-prolyl cis-trans isomerase [Solirubrobacteraceae bacterium]|nr:FKBP-type peptidyl-prolyl cis-trans isomerase [Solirubrobacteraceae bacterium]